jgi:uncharacterized protein
MSLILILTGVGMQYRKFGKLDWKVSALGFGAMRLPLVGGDWANVDEEPSIQMIRYAIEHGVNYIDTAYAYNMGKSEIVLGKALQDGCRAKVRIATKLPSWMVKSYDDFDRFFYEQLERLQTDRIDYYLLHSMNSNHWAPLRDLKVLDWAEKVMAKGQIGYLGFSFHDTFGVFKEILEAYDNWTLCQIQYNYMDEDFQAGTRGLRLAAGKGLAVVVMEPLRGGRLIRKLPERVERLWATAPNHREPVEWALRWVWSHPEVSVLLSGMNSIDQVKENVAIASQKGYSNLTQAELELIGRVRDTYRELVPIPCTACAYCLPCPHGVEIPTIFELYNDAIIYDNLRESLVKYMGPAGMKRSQRADNCQDCKECLEKCPQGLQIPDFLKKAREMLVAKK